MAARTIENKELSLKIKDGDDERQMTYFDLIKVCLNQMPQGGYSRKDIRDRDEIEKKLNEDNKKAEFNHDQFIELRKLCNNMKWNTRHIDIQNFLEYLDDVK